MDKVQSAPMVRLGYLDGLRGWAALSVVIFHSTWETFGVFVPSVRNKYFSLINDGPLSVFVFFVLSGLVLSHSYLQTSDLSKIQRLAVSRYPRLVIPVFSASVIGFVLMKIGMMSNHEAANLLGREDWLGIFYSQIPSISTLLRFSTYDVFFNYDVTRSYDAFLWTMPIELLGSFVLFSLLAISQGITRLRLTLYIISLPLTWFWQPHLTTFIYGIMIADFMSTNFYQRLSKGVIGNIIGIGFLLVSAIASTFYRNDYSVHRYGVLALLIVVGTTLSPALRAFFQISISRWLGHLSFPLYLVHSFVICSFTCSAAIWLNSHFWTPASIVAVVAPTTIVFSLIAAQVFSPVETIAIKSSHWCASLVLHGLSKKPRVDEPVFVHQGNLSSQ